MSKKITVTVSDEDRDEIELFAKYDGRSMSGLLLKCVKSEMGRRRDKFAKWRARHEKSTTIAFPPVGEGVRGKSETVDEA